MARRPATDSVLSHWNHLIENFNTSSKNFYSAVEEAIRHRGIPDATTSRVDHKEGGVLSAQREYLRVKRGRLLFDICAAPFGNGYFFSSWLTHPESTWGLLRALGLVWAAFALVGICFWLTDGFFKGLFLSIVVLPLVFWLLGKAVRRGMLVSEEDVIAIPVFGWLYQRIFSPETYYKIDTMLMFQTAVHAAVMEVLDGITKAKGVRALSELEREPILSGILKR